MVNGNLSVLFSGSMSEFTGLTVCPLCDSEINTAGLRRSILFPHLSYQKRNRRAWHAVGPCISTTNLASHELKFACESYLIFRENLTIGCQLTRLETRRDVRRSGPGGLLGLQVVKPAPNLGF